MDDKIKAAKEAQGYTTVPMQCNTCKHYKSEIVQVEGWYRNYVAERRKRCWIGGFSVNSTSSCKRYTPAYPDKRSISESSES